MPVDSWLVSMEEIYVDIDPEAAQQNAESEDLLFPRLGLFFTPALARVSPRYEDGGVLLARRRDDRIVG